MTAPVRLGVVGAGAIAQVAHLPALTRLDGIRVVALCDNDTAKARSIAARFDIPDVYDDIEVLLRATEPDAVAICTPNHLHEIHTRTALSAGAHVFCERPLALDVAGIQRVIAARTEAGRAVEVGMNHRYRTDTQAVRVFLDGGELGAVRGIRCGWYTFRPARHALGWRRRRDESGGGALLDLGLPMMDLALWLLHDPPPVRITARTVDDGQAGAVEDAAVVLFEAGDTAVTVDVSWYFVGPEERLWFEVLGGKGSATVSPLTVYKELHGSPVDVTPSGASGRHGYTTSYAAQWARFLAVVHGHVPPSDLADQLMLHRLLEAAYRSAREGQTVVLDQPAGRS